MPTTAHSAQALAPLDADDFTGWAFADDGDPDALGELHRRALRDRARRALERDAAALARGAALHRSALRWAAQQLPADHPHARAVRALAHRTRADARTLTGTAGVTQRRAAFTALCALLCTLAAQHTPTVLRTADHLHPRAHRSPLQVTAPRLPRAPSRAGLA